MKNTRIETKTTIAPLMISLYRKNDFAEVLKNLVINMNLKIILFGLSKYRYVGRLNLIEC